MASLGADRPPPRGLGLATATTSATFFSHCELRTKLVPERFTMNPLLARYTQGEENEEVLGGRREAVRVDDPPHLYGVNP